MVVKVYPLLHETTDIRASFDRRRARDPEGGLALAGCLHLAPLPDTSRQRQGPKRLPDSPRPRLQPANGAQRHPRVQPEGSQRGTPTGIAPPTHRSSGFRSGGAEALREMLHQDPRGFGKDTSLWTLDLAAEVSFEAGLTTERVSGETIRATLERLGVRWERAKRWITSPDPEYARKKG